MYINCSAELDVYHNVDLFVTFQNLAFEIKATLHCCKTNNYKFPTMFHLYIKYFIHKLAIGLD